MKQSPPKPTPTSNNEPRRKCPIIPIRFAPPPIPGQQTFTFDFDTDEEPKQDE